MKLEKILETARRFPKKIVIPITAVALTFFPSKIDGQVNPNELPFNPKGFILEEYDVDDDLDVWAYNKEDNRLVAKTTTAHGDTLNTGGGVDSVAGYYSLIIPTDIAATPEIEGPGAGDELYLKIILDGGTHLLVPKNRNRMIHNPGKIERWDMIMDYPPSVEENNPREFNLHQNYPNPFNPATIIRYTIGEKVSVLLDVYNMAGQRVETLVNDVKDKGEHEVKFDGKDLGSGLYFFRMKAGDYKLVRKGLLIK